MIEYTILEIKPITTLIKPKTGIPIAIIILSIIKITLSIEMWNFSAIITAGISTPPVLPPTLNANPKPNPNPNAPTGCEKRCEKLQKCEKLCEKRLAAG